LLTISVIMQLIRTEAFMSETNYPLPARIRNIVVHDVDHRLTKAQFLDWINDQVGKRNCKVIFSSGPNEAVKCLVEIRVNDEEVCNRLTYLLSEELELDIEFETLIQWGPLKFKLGETKQKQSRI
jgi:hypothetical protein